MRVIGIKENGRSSRHGGYIAIMATVIVSAMLLVMVVQEGFSGWHARFNVLGTEAKERASALAEGCADQALSMLIADLTYEGDTTTMTPAGTCRIFPIEFNTPGAGMVTIKSQGQVSDTFANWSIVMNINELHTGAIPKAPHSGTLIVQTLVGGGGSMSPGNFTTRIANVSPSLLEFPGTSSGIIVNLGLGAYSVTQDPVDGYVAAFSPDCTGTINGGEIKNCIIMDSVAITSLTLVANVTNDNNGTNPVTDFSLFINGLGADCPDVNVPCNHPATLGQAYNVAPGDYTADATTLDGYVASDWGYQCAVDGKVTLAKGDNKICMINFDDIPPPNPSCAETVMMLDRVCNTTSCMSSSDLASERTAAGSMVSLYSQVAPPLPLPQMGVGSYGGLDHTDAWIPDASAPLLLDGRLRATDSAGVLKLTNAITQMTASNSGTVSNIAAAIDAANAELSGPRHDQSKQKVLVMLSDGVPNTYVSSTDTGSLPPNADSPVGAVPMGWAVGSNGVLDRWDGDSWSTWASPTGNSLRSVSMLSATDGWAVGDKGTVIRWSGTSWSTKTSGVSSTLRAVSVISANDGWAVGDSGVILRWNGTTWSKVSVPAGTGNLKGVHMTSANDGWAVGDSGVILRWNGTTWSKATSPVTTGLKAIDMLSSTVGWAVGDSGVAIRYDGVRWVYDKFTPVQTGLLAVSAVSATDVWAAGASGVILHWNGASWVTVPSSTTKSINAVTMLSSTYGRAVADGGVILHWNGAIWATATSYTPSALYGVSFIWATTTGDTWQDPANAYSDADGGANASCPMNLGGDQHQYFNFNFPAPSGLDIAGLEAQANAWVYSPPATPAPPVYPTAAGSFSDWLPTPSTSTAIAATGPADSDDTTYIDASAAPLIHTFKMTDAGVPANAVIDSVTLYVVAKGESGATLQLVQDKDANHILRDPIIRDLTPDYQTYSYVFTMRADNTPWTLAEVNNWSTKFGVQTTAGSPVPKVTEIHVKVSYH